jgi:hypothetical protein
MKRLSFAQVFSFLFFPFFLDAKDIRLAPAELALEVSRIDQILQSAHKDNQVSSTKNLSPSLLVRRIYLTAAGRIPSYPELEKLASFDQPNLKEKLIDQLLQSRAYESQMFNWWADHLRAKTFVMGQANQIGAGFLYVDWLKSQVAENVPFDEMARSVIASEGYPWENGAVGYYIRDDGMPLENMSNTAELFLGTQMVCAQCHNHPFDKWTQMEYYKMAAHTYGMVTRLQGERAGEIRKIIKDKQKEMGSMQMSAMVAKGGSKEARAFRQALQDMLLPLQFGARHQDRKLKLPHDYKYDDAKPHQVVQAGVIFDSNTTRENGDLSMIDQYSNWMTSPKNPRFTKVIANRMWKKVFGRGLVEPLNDWKDDTEASIPPLLDHLAELMVRLDYDLREFQRVLMNLEIFEKEAYPKELEPLDPYLFPAPVLTRMSAEQLWDSLLAIFVPEVDERSWEEEVDHIKLKKETLEKYRQKVESMGSAQLIEYVRDGLQQSLEIQEEMNGLSAKIKEAVEADDREELSQLKNRQNQLRGRQQSAIASLIMGEEFDVRPMYRNNPFPNKKPPSPDRKKFPHYLRRASEQNSPTGADHFLREFGQSDRELIDNARKEASVPQVLNLLNSHLRWKVVDPNSVLTQKVMEKPTVEEKIEVIYLGMLQRKPTDEELNLCIDTLDLGDPPLLAAYQKGIAPEKQKNAEKKWEWENKRYFKKVHDELRHLAWALLNTREFSFIQ